MTPDEIEAVIEEASELLRQFGFPKSESASGIAAIVQDAMCGRFPELDSDLFYRCTIALAVRGHQPTREALLDTARALHSTGDRLPRWLQGYVVFAGGLPQRERGRSIFANAVRDGGIALAVHRICQRYHLHPTRNVASAERVECGCSIVEEALKRLNIHMTAPNLARIWVRWGATIEKIAP